ncbi:MAG: hypothetical protein PHI12_08460 [Dehalococcoidales bacterium]|nr:hypothetical protein [Dehalococcoidales bacterium]
MSTSYLIPKHLMMNGQANQYRLDTIKQIVDEAKRLRIVDDPKHLDITGLTYEDLGLSSWRTPNLSYETTAWFTKEIPPGYIYAITEVMLLSIEPITSIIQFRSGCSFGPMRGFYSLDGLKVILPVIRRAKGDRPFQNLLLKNARRLCLVGLLSEPIIYRYGQIMSVTLKADGGILLGSDQIAIGGFVASPAGAYIA